MYSGIGFGWMWLVWIGLVLVMFSSFGNWGYTYRLHKRYGAAPKGALDLLDERYARGEVTHDEYGRMKSEMVRAPIVKTGR